MSKKRPGSMDDDERALVGREHRDRERDKVITPVHGVPVRGDDDDDFTPIHGAIERLDEQLGLTPRELMIFRTLWQHSANMEMRSRRRSDSQETATLRREIDELQASVVDIVGKDGKNGKVGELGRRVDKADSRRWAVIMWLLGLGVAVVTASISIGVWKGGVDTDIRNLKARVYRAQFNAPEYPTKDKQ